MNMSRALALCLLVAVPLSAEENCGRMMRSVSRFQGKVLSIEKDDVATIAIESVQEAGSPLRSGQSHRVTIAEPVEIGEHALEIEWMQCDGEFRRFLGVRKLAPERVVESADDRWLEPGHSYRAEARWSVDRDMLTLVKPLDLPRHHGGGISWTNLDDIPLLPRDGSTFTITFEVVSLEITHMEERRWVSLYDAKIIAVDEGPPAR